MKFELMKNDHGAVITHVALALGGIEREDVAQLIVSPQMALILKGKMSVKEIMTGISSMVMTASELAHRLVEMCEPQCEDCDYDCISELLNSAVDSACMDIAKQYSSSSEQTMDNAYEWGENIEIPDDHRNCEFCVGSHPAVLDGFITEYRKAAEEQKQDFKLDL